MSDLSAGSEHRRATDSWYYRWGAPLINVAAVGLAAIAIYLVVGEGEQRRDGQCRLFERQEAAAIANLRRTYDFLAHPPPKLASLRPLALAQLAETERDARASRAPAYCNKPGVGLREPKHPKPFPRRPRGLILHLRGRPRHLP